jgi:hypothetical protein
VNELECHTASPFDSIKHTDENGDYWLAREMWQPAGYAEWRDFEYLVNKAQDILKDIPAGQSMVVVEHNHVRRGFGGEQEKLDYRCTRYGALLILSRSNKPELADYFVAQAMFAENVQRQRAAVTAASSRFPNASLKASATMAQVRSLEAQGYGLEAYDEVDGLYYLRWQPPRNQAKKDADRLKHLWAELERRKTVADDHNENDYARGKYQHSFLEEHPTLKAFAEQLGIAE